MSLRIDDLVVHYQTMRGPVQAIDGVTMTVADGEIMGLAGESGCGKSTLGNALVRLAPPMKLVRGRAELDGVELPLGDSPGMKALRFAEVAVVPQYAMSALNPTRKIGRMVSELLESRKVSYRDTLPELEKRLDLVGLPRQVLTMYPIELSGGMKQRMVMVLSTLLNPSLLIADEVTSALDVSSQRAVAEMLVEFRDRGFVKSIIVITHDMSVLSQIADTILVMYAGKVVEKGPTEQLIHNPRHPYTRALVSSLPEVGVRFKDRRLTGLAGAPPSLLDPPAGCRFRPRCPVAFDRCGEDPPMLQLAPGHTSACWRNLEEVELDPPLVAARPATEGVDAQA